MRRVSLMTRDEWVETVAKRFVRSSRGEKGRILDEFVAVTGLSQARCACCGAIST